MPQIILKIKFRKLFWRSNTANYSEDQMPQIILKIKYRKLFWRSNAANYSEDQMTISQLSFFVQYS